MSVVAEVQKGITTWSIDPNHSDVQFSVKHLGLMTVRGHFEKVTGKAKTEDGKLVGFEAVIDAASVNTRVADRDKHLRSADFLGVEKYPELSFKSTSVQSLGGSQYKVTGDLTLHGQTHPVDLSVDVSDTVKDPWGNTRSSAIATGQISRKQWGLEYNQVLEAGGLLVGDEVKITIEVEGLAS